MKKMPLKKRILIIDDEQFLLNSIERDLRELKNEFEIHTSTNSKDTLKMIEELGIELLITDMLMPGKEGVEIIREVKKECPSVKVIAMTGRPSDYLEFAESFGAIHTLSKPFSKDDLIAAINSIFHE